MCKLFIVPQLVTTAVSTFLWSISCWSGLVVPARLPQRSNDTHSYSWNGCPHFLVDFKQREMFIFFSCLSSFCFGESSWYRFFLFTATFPFDVSLSTPSTDEQLESAAKPQRITTLIISTWVVGSFWYWAILVDSVFDWHVVGPPFQRLRLGWWLHLWKVCTERDYLLHLLTVPLLLISLQMMQLPSRPRD